MPDDGSNATLELDPVEAETVILAQRVGQLSLTLRSVLDANVAGTAAMLRAAEEAGVRRFVHVSSLAAREPELSAYGRSKARAAPGAPGRSPKGTRRGSRRST